MKVIGCEMVDWINLAQERVMWHAVVKVLINLQVQ